MLANGPTNCKNEYLIQVTLTNEVHENYIVLRFECYFVVYPNLSKDCKRLDVPFSEVFQIVKYDSLQIIHTCIERLHLRL